MTVKEQFRVAGLPTTWGHPEFRDWRADNDCLPVQRLKAGGAVAALAAGFVPLELGSDIGGSLRVPAHFCGVFSHKPSLDLVPSRGAGPPHTPPIPARGDLAVIGPMARSAADLALALTVTAGPDELAEGIGYKLTLPPPRHDKLADFRVLVIDS